MKKKEVVRTYNFDNGELVTITCEKITFIRRNIVAFSGFGINTAIVDELESKNNLFSTANILKAYIFLKLVR